MRRSAARASSLQARLADGDPGFPKRFVAAGRPGAYLRVISEGDIGAGDQITVVARPTHGVTSELVSRAILLAPDLLAEAQRAPELPEDLREWMQERAEHAAQRRAQRAAGIDDTER